KAQSTKIQTIKWRLVNASNPDVSCTVSIVLPAFNEQTIVAEVVREVREALDGWPDGYEILVVDDGSTDRTADSAEAAGAGVIRRAERGGYGAAVKTGLLAARGEFVALIDADGSYDPADLPRLLATVADPRCGSVEPETSRPADGTYLQAIGVRDREAGSLRWLRAPAKWVIRKFAEWIAGRRIPDLNSGIRVFRRDVMLKYLWVIPDGFSCSTSITLAFLSNGHAVRFVPVTYRPRDGRSKFRPLRDGTNYAFTIIRMTTYFRPLRVFVPLAAALALAAVVKGAYDIIHSPTGLGDTDVILAVGSLVVFAVGLLADLIVAQKRDA
ncbi:MAG TPA: glycosyltransferase family 2 protein, partial [Planctomycetaceae bacterium]|nr:glycosyltransferase family 2 protein [Planctomycetaceae bacterium]